MLKLGVENPDTKQRVVKMSVSVVPDLSRAVFVHSGGKRGGDNNVFVS